MLKSFRSRLVIWNLLITLAGLLVVVFVFTQVLANHSQDIRRQELSNDSRLTASQIEYLFRHGGSTSDLRNTVYSASRALQVRVIVTDPEGVFRVDSSSATPFFRGSWQPLDRSALKKLQSASKQLSSGNVRSFQSPLKGTRGRVAGAVILVASVSDVRPGLYELRNVLLVVLGTALLVWLAIGLFFTFSISRPLLRVTEATQLMARGRYDTRVPAEGNGEIARLAASFNVMAEQVQRTNRVLKDFVANVSHDLRTPLTMITGFSQAVLDGTAQAGEIEESAAVIHEEAVKMQHMVDDLLQLTRLESGLLTFRRQPVEVHPFVQSAIDRVTRAGGDQPRASILNKVPEKLPPIEVDREHVERALQNLLNNALQYTPPEGTVEVSARPIGRGWVEMAITDTGIGIARQDLPRIFERFYRSDKSRERVHGHSGLGLASVREIVEGHGGRIEVESEMNRGTTFRFTVPQAQSPQIELEQALAREQAGTVGP